MANKCLVFFAFWAVVWRITLAGPLQFLFPSIYHPISENGEQVFSVFCLLGSSVEDHPCGAFAVYRPFSTVTDIKVTADQVRVNMELTVVHTTTLMELADSIKCATDAFAMREVENMDIQLEEYPKIVAIKRILSPFCFICKITDATWLILHSDRLPIRRAFFCTKSCKPYMFEDGKKNELSSKDWESFKLLLAPVEKFYGFKAKERIVGLRLGKFELLLAPLVHWRSYTVLKQKALLARNTHFEPKLCSVGVEKFQAPTCPSGEVLFLKQKAQLAGNSHFEPKLCSDSKNQNLSELFSILRSGKGSSYCLPQWRKSRVLKQKAQLAGNTHFEPKLYSAETPSAYHEG
ncbi:hypothetical protein HUJ04_011783 [Dendroctonus ponderosae]|nr:hypothetical protein HUJ04_011783 [Dendroctonus ponderosae]